MTRVIYGPSEPSPARLRVERAFRRVATCDGAFVLACILAHIVLLYLGRHMTFFGDEWSWIDLRTDWSLDTLMQPHNEHWSLGLAFLYKPFLATVGLRTYIPYLAVLLLLHIAVAAAVYRYLRQRVGGIVALGAGVVFLFLGSGSENFFGAFLMGLGGATAAGVWALILLLDDPAPRRPWLVAALLLAAVVTGGMGLFFVVACAAVLIVSPSKRRLAWVLAPAVVVYGAWYLLIGRKAVQSASFGLDTVPAWFDYIRVGVANAAGSLSGLGDQIGLILMVLFGVAAVVHIVGRDPLRAGLIAGLVGLLAQFAVTALARAQLRSAQAEAPRYVYTGAVFLLVAFGSWLSGRLTGVDRWRLASAVGVLVAVALVSNAVDLIRVRAWFLANADQTRAVVTLMTQYGGSPSVPADQPMWGPGIYFPAPARLREVLAEFGSPLGDALVPAGRAIPEAVLDTTLFRLVAGSVVREAVSGLPSDLSDLAIGTSLNASVTPAEGCVRIEPTAADPQVYVTGRGGSDLYAKSDRSGNLQVFLSMRSTWSQQASMTFPIIGGVVNQISLPDLGDGSSWLVRVDPPEDGDTVLCAGTAATPAGM